MLGVKAVFLQHLLTRSLWFYSRDIYKFILYSFTLCFLRLAFFAADTSATDLISLFLYQVNIAATTAREIVNKEATNGNDGTMDQINGSWIGRLLFLLVLYYYLSNSLLIEKPYIISCDNLFKY